MYTRVVKSTSPALQITLVILGSRFDSQNLKIARAATFGSDVSKDHGVSMATRSRKIFLFSSTEFTQTSRFLLRVSVYSNIANKLG